MEQKVSLEKLNLYDAVQGLRTILILLDVQ